MSICAHLVGVPRVRFGDVVLPGVQENVFVVSPAPLGREIDNKLVGYPRPPTRGIDQPLQVRRIFFARGQIGRSAHDDVEFFSQPVVGLRHPYLAVIVDIREGRCLHRIRPLHRAVRRVGKVIGLTRRLPIAIGQLDSELLRANQGRRHARNLSRSTDAVAFGQSKGLPVARLVGTNSLHLEAEILTRLRVRQNHGRDSRLRHKRQGCRQQHDKQGTFR